MRVSSCRLGVALVLLVGSPSLGQSKDDPTRTRAIVQFDPDNFRQEKVDRVVAAVDAFGGELVFDEGGVNGKLLVAVPGSWFAVLKQLPDVFRVAKDGTCVLADDQCSTPTGMSIGVEIGSEDSVRSSLEQLGAEIYSPEPPTVPAFSASIPENAIPDLASIPGVTIVSLSTASPLAPPGEVTLLRLGVTDRFLARVSWSKGSDAGFGFSRDILLDSGGFWFFENGNLELLVKILDGCDVNGHYWLFVSGLTDLGLDVAVQDLKTQETIAIDSPEGILFESYSNVTAFSGCE